MKSFLTFAIVVALINAITTLYLTITLNKPEGLVFVLVCGAALGVFVYEYKKRF